MGYPLPPYGRRPARRTEPQPDRVPAGLAVFEEQFKAKEFGSFGEFFAPSAPPAQTTRQQGLVIPPPDWEAEERERRQRGAAGPEPQQPLYPGAALEQMKRQLGDESEPRFTPGPALEYAPVERFKAQPVDWEEEERRAFKENRRAELERARRILAESENP